jgi:hypothetical protein
MTDDVQLDRTARDLIDAGREGARPSPLAVERVRRAVALELGGGGRERSPRSKFRAAAKLLVPALAIGGALYAAERARTWGDGSAPVKEVQQAPSPSPKSAPARPEPLAQAADSASALAAGGAARSGPLGSARVAVKAPPSTSPVVAPSGLAGTSGPSPRADQLGAEIELLARANSAVNAGDAGRALVSLREYDRRFGAGILREERAAASVLALCAAGRTREARAEAERFVRGWPRSPLLSRIEGSCAGRK